MSIESIRSRINDIDKELVQLITDRMACSEEIGKLKTDSASPVRDRAREKEILDRVTAQSGELELPLRIIYEALFAQSRQVQMDLAGGSDSFGEDVAATRTELPFPSSAIVAYQDNDYAQRAAESLFEDCQGMLFQNGQKIADAVDQGLCDFGVLPIEDNRTGAYEETYQYLREHTTHIVRSVRLYLDYDLLAPDNLPLDKVRKVVGGYVSMVHCSKFLQKLRNVELVTVDRLVPEEIKLGADDGKTAYMVPPNTPIPEGFMTLRQSIGNRGDYLRYICIAPQPIIYPGADRMSLLLSTEDVPGGLGEILARFAAVNVNLSLLESRPTKVGTETFHRFFIDMESGIEDPMVQGVLGQLHRDASVFRFLGAYEQIEVNL